jgi:membrane protein DedA with SNARE-associated domain
MKVAIEPVHEKGDCSAGARREAYDEEGLEALFIRYGFVSVLIGVAVEWEPFALAGGVLAQRGAMSLWMAVGAAFVGSCVIDQFWFQLARRARTIPLVTSVRHRAAFARSLASLERHPVRFVVFARFVYGLRAVAAVAIGISRVSGRLFTPLNIATAGAWSALFTGLGYLSGPVSQQLSNR